MEEQNTNTQPQTNLLTPVPGAVISLVFGIISLVLCWYFFVPVLGIVFNAACLVLAVLGMKKGKLAMATFEGNQGQYKQGSYSIAKVGKTLGLVGLILNALFLLIALIITVLWIIAMA